MPEDGDRQVVWFFDEPFIFFCPKCNTTDMVYDNDKGIRCGSCGVDVDSLSEFKWTGEGPDPI